MTINQLINDIRADAIRVREQAKVAADRNEALALEEYAKDCEEAADRLTDQLFVKLVLSDAGCV